MQLSELIKRLNRSPDNECTIDVHQIAIELEMYAFGSDIKNEDLQLKGYYLARSSVTDNHVGTIALFLNDDLAAITALHARKSDTLYSWLSTDIFNKVSDYLISIDESTKEKSENIETISLNKEMGEGYTVPYSDHLHTSNVIYLPTNEKVTIIEHHHDHQNYDFRSIVTIKFANDVTKQANLKTEILVPYELLD